MAYDSQDSGILDHALLKTVYNGVAGNGVISGMGLSVTGSDLTVTIAAGVVVSGGVRTEYAGGTVSITTAAGNDNPRMDAIIWDDSAGAPAVLTGTPTAESASQTKPPLNDPSDDNDFLLGVAYMPAGATTVTDATLFGRAMTVSMPPLNYSAQSFVETSGQKQWAVLGPPVGTAHAYATDELVGAGWVTLEGASSASIAARSDTGADGGAWFLSTGTTSGEDCGFIGPLTYYTFDWTWEGRVRVPSATTQSIIFGVKATANFADENNMIAFRVTDTGNVIGVCDSGGTETIRDTGATGAVEATYRIEVRNAGTIVRFYKNGVQVGADVTTNIPTTAPMFAACGIRNTNTNDRSMYVHDLFHWREVA